MRLFREDLTKIFVQYLPKKKQPRWDCLYKWIKRVQEIFLLHSNNQYFSEVNLENFKEYCGLVWLIKPTLAKVTLKENGKPGLC